MENEISNKEWSIAENRAKNIREKIQTHFMESAITSDSEYVKVEVLVPMTKNINMEFQIDVPYKFMDEENVALLEYFIEHIYKPENGSYMSETINKLIAEKERNLQRLQENLDKFDAEAFMAGKDFEECFGSTEYKEPEDILDTVIDETVNDDVSAEDDYCFEMASVKGGFMNIKLCIFGKEGQHPHFHFYHNVAPNKGIPNDGAGGGCILINEAKYFTHGTHSDTMKKKEIKGLIEFLNSNHSTFGVTMWKYVIELWNDNNPECTQVDINSKIPQYFHNMPNYNEKNKDNPSC